MAYHDVKVSYEEFAEIIKGAQLFLLRKEDISMRIGDILVLREWNPRSNYSGREIRKAVTAVSRNQELLRPGTICIGLKA